MKVALVAIEQTNFSFDRLYVKINKILKEKLYGKE